MKPSVVIPNKSTSFLKGDFSRITADLTPCSMDISPPQSDGSSVSMDETMSTCDSLKSPEVEYLDNNDIAAVDSIERKTSSKLYISEHIEAAGFILLFVYFSVGL